MFTPSNITPLPRRGLPLALILRGILVAAVAMALLATLAAHPSGSYRDAGSPYRVPWEETLGAPSSRPVQTEQTSVVPQSLEESGHSKSSPRSIRSDTEAYFLRILKDPQDPERLGWRTHSGGRREASGQESGEIATSTALPPTPTALPPTPTPLPPTPTPLPPTPTPVPPTLTPASSLIPTSLETLVSPVVLSDLESQMWEAINGERANAGLVPLAIDERLVGLARERSNDMMTRGYFSHTTPEGKMIFDFLDSRGIDSPYAGENLARTNAEASQAVQLVLSGFMNSPTHRKNVLNSHYTYLGIGEAISPVLTGSHDKGMRYFTLVFIGTHL